VIEVLSRGVRIRLQPFNPVFRSANLIIAPLSFCFASNPIFSAKTAAQQACNRPELAGPFNYNLPRQ
jgi:hypothetical protein